MKFDLQNGQDSRIRPLAPSYIDTSHPISLAQSYLHGRGGFHPPRAPPTHYLYYHSRIVIAEMFRTTHHGSMSLRSGVIPGDVANLNDLNKTSDLNRIHEILENIT